MSFSTTQAYSAIKALEACTKLFNDKWSLPRVLNHKGRIDLVTDMDMLMQEELSAALASITPGVPLICEESAPDVPDFLDVCWIVDPVDGTTNCAHGIPMVGIVAAYCEGGKPVFGMTSCPRLGESWWALKNRGCFMNGSKISVSSVDRLEDALVATGFPYDIDKQVDNVSTRLAGVLEKAQGVRRFGAASLDLAYVACGRMDAYYEGGLHLWDYMAGWLFVEEAGGLVTNDRGTLFVPGDVIVASSGKGNLHGELLAAMNAYEPETLKRRS